MLQLALVDVVESVCFNVDIITGVITGVLLVRCIAVVQPIDKYV